MREQTEAVLRSEIVRLQAERVELVRALRDLLSSPDLNLENLDDSTLDAIENAEFVLSRQEGL